MMVDVLPKLREMGDPWAPQPSTTKHYNQRKQHLRPSKAFTDHDQGQGSHQQYNHGSDFGGNRRGSKGGGHLRSRISRGWEQEPGTSSSRFLPAPRPSKHKWRTRDQSAKKILDQIKLADRLAEFKNHPTIFPDPLRRPFHGRGCICMPFSSAGLTDETTTKLGLHNLLRVSTGNSDRYYLTRKCCYVFHCMNLRTSFSYPNIPNKMVIQDERVSSAIEQVVLEEMEEKGVEAGNDRTYYKLVAQHTARAHNLLNNMKAAISSTLIRITGYVLFKVFSNLLMSVTVHGGQQEVIERAARRDTPVIFVPLHRSHVDYLFVTWVLFNRQIPAPIVAAGDNLRIPVFGWLLRGLGGFFIKRRLESCKARKDIVYRAVLQTYVTHALQAGYNLEFFIEGGRTRTGKPCMPKGGLLSVIVDAYMNGTLDDALIVPIAINYDKLLDGNFIREQMGQSKVPESFWGAVRAIIKVLSTNYGHARIDFGQPFSLREFVQTSKIIVPQLTLSQPQNQAVSQSHTQPLLGCTPPNSPSPLSLTPPADESPQTQPPHPLDSSSLSVTGRGHQRSLSSPATNNHMTLKRSSSNPSSTLNSVNRTCNNLHGARSSSSLFGSEVTEEYRTLIKSLSRHIVYDAERCQAIMSTNAIAWLLLYVYRDGTTRSSLVKALDALRESLRTKERDTGFSGSSKDIVKHAVRLLGAGLVRVEESKSTDGTEVVIKPITLLPNIIELSYYASALAPVFAVDAIVATSLLSIVGCDLWSYRDCSPDIHIDREKLIKRAAHLSKLLEFEFLLAPPCASLEAKLHETVDNLVVMGLLVDAGKTGSRWIEDSDEDDVSYSQCYKVSPSTATLEVIAAWRTMLTPMLDAYYCTACNLQTLVGRQVPDIKFIQNTQSYINDLLQKGSLRYGESICVDPIRNAVKVFESQSIIESYTHDSVRLLYLSSAYDSEEQLATLLHDIDSFRL